MNSSNENNNKPLPPVAPPSHSYLLSSTPWRGCEYFPLLEGEEGRSAPSRPLPGIVNIKHFFVLILIFCSSSPLTLLKVNISVDFMLQVKGHSTLRINSLRRPSSMPLGRQGKPLRERVACLAARVCSSSLQPQQQQQQQQQYKEGGRGGLREEGLRGVPRNLSSGCTVC